VPLACARSAGQVHPVFGLWSVDLRADLRRSLKTGERKIDRWTARHGIALADFTAEPIDPFFNVNTPEDLLRAEAMAS
jgi:molybdopterin-guanine dinucleotide biosynthesis protein A